MQAKALPQPTSPTLLRVEWDPKEERDCSLASAIFMDQRVLGRLVFSVDEKWNPKEQLKTFDKNPGRMVVMPRPTAWDKLREERP